MNVIKTFFPQIVIQSPYTMYLKLHLCLEFVLITVFLDLLSAKESLLLIEVTSYTFLLFLLEEYCFTYGTFVIWLPVNAFFSLTWQLTMVFIRREDCQILGCLFISALFFGSASWNDGMGVLNTIFRMSFAFHSAIETTLLTLGIQGPPCVTTPNTSPSLNSSL